MDSERSAELGRKVADLIACDEQIRKAQPIEEISAAIAKEGTPLAQIVATVLEGYADRPALGERAVEFVTDENGRRRARALRWFDTVTYGELWRRVCALASAWHHDSRHPTRAGDFIAILGFTSIDYTIVDLTCNYLGLVSVPLQAGASEAQLTPIVVETEPRVLAADIEQLERAVDLLLVADSVRSLVVFGYRAEDDDHRTAVEAARQRLSDVPVQLETVDAVIARGQDLPAAPLYTGGDQDALALLLYTSGSTGTPKGAMYPQRLVTGFWLRAFGAPIPSIAVSYLPMSHMAGRGSLFACLSVGGTAYFAARSDMSTLFEDISLVRPTTQFFVPRVCELVFQRFQSGVDRRLADGGDRDAVEQQVKTELREQLLGGRFLSVTVGSAPLSAQMKTFMESVLDTEVIIGYGATESGGILVGNEIQRPPVIDYKLVDVPELGYLSTDKPFPRGELLVKSETMFPGYYKRPELNAEVFDADAFYRTGDIMAEIGPDQLQYLDRRNNVLKLSQGEFVTVSKLEAIFTSSPLVRQIYVYGNSERAYLLAVIVPTETALAAHSDVADLKGAINESLQQIAKHAELNPYEIPRDFLMENEPFSIDNGLLSGIGKVLRPKLKQRYGERLEQLYIELEQGQEEELRALRREGRDMSVRLLVGRAVRALSGCATTDIRPDAHFIDLGGDSLSALSLSNLLQEVLGVEVPVGVIVSPAIDLQQLANLVEQQQRSGDARPTAASVHGTGTQIRATDLSLDKFISAETLTATTDLPRAGQLPRTVLLTGANGYLGRFLCMEWLQRLHDVGGTVICLVRGNDATAARKRLDDVFDSGDPELLRRYRESADGTLEVLAGDISDPSLGLTEQDWRRLAETVDLIVHPAALVNHVLPYNQLFGPNVVGTAEIIRLALTSRIKPVTYLSSVSVASQSSGAFTEDGDIREMSPLRSIDDGYANGYGNSKWAGEVLLRNAHSLCGLPVSVFRSDMILAHSRYAGQLNVPDMFTRLILSLLATGLAPKSFYQLDGDGNRQRAHYDGLPVDFTAAAITTLGAEPTSEFETFDVLNPHDDGISEDEFVDWLIEAGQPIERVDDYAEWLSRFETGLRHLPEQQRQHSVLPLLRAYQRPAAPIRGSVLPAKNFQIAVQEAEIGPDRDIPHLSPALINKYVSDLMIRKLL
ncbi:carboxylic acid reductase [Nocardia sp. NPDC049149]|uniref:carboxylic acid reductase n=1 Tax=Nocardia sp. NPDC049149 TaxID=3364315 RepID=UPI0037179191